jgi:hypothetical protein
VLYRFKVMRDSPPSLYRFEVLGNIPYTFNNYDRCISKTLANLLVEENQESDVDPKCSFIGFQIIFKGAMNALFLRFCFE